MEKQQITMQAHAKINLTLDVTGRLPNGYHTVTMVMQSVALHDMVTVSVGESGMKGICLTCSRPDLPTDESNLAFRAAALFYQTTGVPTHTTRIDIAKRIPVAAGLAGGSTDAAAVLRALNTLHGTGLTDGQLCEMGLQLGADVPYCLLGGTMLATGIGEVLAPLPAPPACHAVLCKPPVAVSTREIYESIDAAALTRRPDTAALCAALHAGDFAAVCDGLCNVMEEVTRAKHPEIAEIRAALSRCGAEGTLMSGSGPTVFGLFSDGARAAAAAEQLKAQYEDTFLTTLV